MININQLKPSTLEALKIIYNEYKDTIECMQKSGTAFEKSIAALIIAASGESQNA